MVDEKNLILNANQDSGEIVVALEVIKVIIGITASKVEGVHRMHGTFASNVTKLLGRAAYGKSVYLADEEDGLKVDLYYHLEYSVSVPKVAMETQGRISQQVFFITDIDLAEVNIHVIAVVPKKLEQPTIEELFGDEEEENE